MTFSTTTTTTPTFSISDVLVDKSESMIEQFTCTICFDNIYKKEVLQCKEGHWNCKECWTELLKKNKSCPSCRCVVNSAADLSRNRFIEKEFANKKVYCPNSVSNTTTTTTTINISKEGDMPSECCKEIITIEQLENHLTTCQYSIVQCRYCRPEDSIQLKRHELPNHFKLFNHSYEMNLVIEKQEKQISEQNKKYQEILDRMVGLEMFVMKENENKLSAVTPKYDFRNSIIFSNYSTYKSKKPSEGISSVALSVGQIDKFKLTLYPNGYDDTHKGFASVYLFRSNITDPSITISFTITFLNKDNRKNKSYLISQYTFPNGSSSGWGFPKTLKSEDIFNKDGGWITEEDKLVVSLKVQILSR